MMQFNTSPIHKTNSKMKLFDSIKVRKPKLNKFDKSHERKLSLDMGKLVPILLEEIIPGDKFRVNTEIMMRLIPMLAPIMHRVNVYTHYFFVPNRLVWSEWEDFITGGRLGTSAPVHPHFLASDLTNEGFMQGRSTLCNYFGLPTTTDAATSTGDALINALPFRAYQLIYDEYYRDQNVQAELDILKTSGLISPGAEFTKLNTLRQRAWEKDYFTSSLPFAQRGPAVGIPVDIDADAPVLGKPVNGGTSSMVVEAIEQPGSLSTGLTLQVDQTLPNTPTKLWARLTGLSSSTSINDLRRSIRLQEWLEKNARGGARYIEQILSHWGVVSSDARLQRPQYIGGGKAPVQISEVLQTVQQVADDAPVGDPLGEMGGHGFSVGNMNGFSKRFEEHGFVIGIMSVLPRTAYQQGIHKMWSRMDKLDYAWPEFANLGEQEVLQKELYFTGATPSGDLLPDAVFGYQSRYAEMKYGCSSVHGEFQDSLAFWHMGRIFDDVPLLNEAFVSSDPTKRIFANESANETLYCHLYNRVDALRPLPYYGTPML